MRWRHPTSDPLAPRRPRRRLAAPLWARLLALLLLLALAPVPPAAAQGFASPPEPDPLSVLVQYGIIKGNPQGDLRLHEPVTRAEMAVLLVRAAGRETETQFHSGQDPFTDIRTHWARGHIAVAARLGLVRGFPDGAFQPERVVTYVEALAMLLRLVEQEPPPGPWPRAVTDFAAQLGIAPPTVPHLTAAAHQPAIRRDLIHSLYRAMVRVKVGAEGRNLLQRVDTIPPRLTVDPLTDQTGAPMVVVSGTSDGHWVRVGDTYVLVENGRFQAAVPLAPGTNLIPVEAADLADNRTLQTISIIRGHPLDRIAIIGPDRMAINERVQYQVAGYDTMGNILPLPDIDVQVEGEIGTFDQSTMRFQAAGKAARGRLLVSASGLTGELPITVLGPSPNAAALRITDLNGGRPLVAGETAVIGVEVVDRRGNPVPEDAGREITLTVPEVWSATVEPATIVTRGGAATFRVHVPVTGTFNLVAASDRLRAAQVAARFLPPAMVKLRVSEPLLVADGYMSGQISAVLVNPYDEPVLNHYGRDIVIELQKTGVDATLTDGVLRIPMGQSVSTTSATLIAGKKAGTVTVGGTIALGLPVLAEPVDVALVPPIRGKAVAVQIVGPRSSVKANEPATFEVQVVDGYGRPVTDTRHAFAIRVRAEHDPGSADRLPEGISVRIGAIDLDPQTGMVGRTLNGKAKVVITSDRSGWVEVEPVLVGPISDGAYDDLGVPGAAEPTLDLRWSGASATFVGKAAGIRVEVDSRLAPKAEHGALARSGAATAIVRVLVVDDKGARVPGAREKVTLARTGGDDATVLPSVLERTTEDGVAEYLIRAGAVNGTDSYQATHAKLGSSNEVFLTVQDQVPVTPKLIAVRGARDGSPQELNLVAANDDTMEVEVETIPGVAAIAVYREGTATPIYTTPPLDLTGGRYMVRVPKEKVPFGVFRYEVTLINALGESPRSTASMAVLHEDWSIATLSRARYDAVTRQLTLVGGGFSATDGTIRPDRLVIAGDAGTLSLKGAAARVKSGTEVVLDLIDLPAVVAELDDPTRFGGPDVHVRAETGWYLTRAGLAARAHDRVPVVPMARIEAAHLNQTARTLTLEGVGFAGGNLDLSKLRVVNLANGQQVSLTGSRAARSGDRRWTITLSQPVADALSDPARFSGGQVQLTTDPGWMIESGARSAAMPDGNLVYWQVELTIARFHPDTGKLVISGARFAGGQVTPALLEIRDLDGPILSLAGATATINSEGHVEISLTAGQIAALTGGSYAGMNIYVVAQPGWFEIGGWPTGPIPVGVLRMDDPTQP